MSGLKPFLIISLILSLGYMSNVFDIKNVLAETSTNFSQEVISKYNDFLRFNQNLKTQSQDPGKFITNLSTLNTKELTNLEKEYKEITIDENVSLENLPQIQAEKTLSLSIIRYENLNQSLYNIIDKLKSAGDLVNESGFSASNINQEIENLTSLISQIEAHISTLNYINTQINEKKVTLEEGLTSASNIINDTNSEYEALFPEIEKLIKSYVQ